MELHVGVFIRGVAVDADDYTLLALDLALVAVGCLIDLALHITLLDSLYGPAQPIDSLYVLPGFLLDGVGEGLDEVGAGQWIGGVGQSCLVRQDLLCPQGYPGALLGR